MNKQPDDDALDEASEESMPASDPPSWTPVTGVHVDAATEAPAQGIAQNNTALHRFELRLPEGIAELRYRTRGTDRLVLSHTEVPRSLQGRGIASRLAHEALEYARAHRMKVIPVCPFVRAYLDRHPEYADLITDK